MDGNISNKRMKNVEALIQGIDHFNGNITFPSFTIIFPNNLIIGIFVSRKLILSKK
jgi:hypothetical protein